ncbi:hypothetical protein OZ410_11300 [Robiginitalea sp. M366]|uniref:hypothetical protein n=1 Tax=Robiginitalea aestuariiviva TaxID=3036903 RepID=UPI00240E5BC7|nr:hypothetical protein [Robiginitalea aestuariiviva]MDG1572903.1 hypothetical protein [Robiginitalea aestuariiviva]
MKWIYFNIILLLIQVCFGQDLKRDTLFFEYDPDYILDGDIIPNNRDQLLLKVFKLQKKSEYEGYIYLLKDTIKVGYKPENVLSLKETIENKKYYFDGPFNRLVNKNKLESKLLDKYQVIFVRNDSFIIPKYIQYNTFYPKGKGFNYVDKRQKDTLVFQFEEHRWNTSFEPEYGKQIFTLTDKTRKGGLYFSVKDKLTDREFSSLEISEDAFINDIEEYIAYQKNTSKGLKYAYYNEQIAYYFEHYEVYLRMGEYYFKLDPVTYEY